MCSCFKGARCLKSRMDDAKSKKASIVASVLGTVVFWQPSTPLSFSLTHSLLHSLSVFYSLSQVLAPPLQKDYYPFFTFCEKRQCEILTPEISIAESDFHRTPSAGSISDNFLVVECLTNSEPP